MNRHRGEYIQRGRGLGSFFKSIIRTVLPALSSVGKAIIKSPTTSRILKTAKRSAIDAGLNVASDVLEGRDLGDSLQSNLVTVVEKVAKRANTTPKKRKGGRRKGKHVGRKKKGLGGSIFD